MATHILYSIKTLKRGPLGNSYLLSSFIRAKHPAKANKSPHNRFHQQIFKNLTAAVSETGWNTESQSIIRTPTDTKSTPPIYPSWHYCFLKSLRMVIVKNLSRRKQNVCELAVNRAESIPTTTQMQLLRDLINIFLRISGLSNALNFSSWFVVALCSLITKGIRSRAETKYRHPDLVIL